jgi:hypothetical protein
MGRASLICGMVVAIVFVSAATANPVNVYFVQGPQDPGGPFGQWDELGIGFPPNELISTAYVGTTNQTSCPLGPGDNPNIPNVLVSMTNLTSRSFYEPWYVADPETSITNYDGWVGNAGLNDAQFAFMIDGSIGTNQPLVSGDVNGNFAFDPGETWTFILQDWSNSAGGNPQDFDSLGIASMSQGWPPSTGSIIAIVPEPATLSLLALGVLPIIRRKR